MKIVFCLLSMYGVHLYAADEPELELTKNDLCVARGMITIANTFFDLIANKNKELQPEHPVPGMTISSYWARDCRTNDIDPHCTMNIHEGLMLKNTTLYCRFGAWQFTTDKMVTGLMRQSAQKSEDYWGPLFKLLHARLNLEEHSSDEQGNVYYAIRKVGTITMPSLLIEQEHSQDPAEPEAASSSQSNAIEPIPIEKKKLRDYLRVLIPDFSALFNAIGDWTRKNQEENKPRQDAIEIKRLSNTRLSTAGVWEPFQPEPEITWQEKERIACWRKLYQDVCKNQKK